jgi:hypothetical protein
MLFKMTPPLPVPVLPASLQRMVSESFPRSPVASVFSIPVTIGCESLTPERVPSPPPTSPDPVSPTSNKILSYIGSVKRCAQETYEYDTLGRDVT